MATRAKDGKWAKGHSGNPKGRSPTRMALAEKIRGKVKPETLIDIALGIAENKKNDPRDIMQAVKWLGEHGWGRPLQQIELEAHFEGDVGIGLDGAAARVVGQLADAERMRRIADLEAKRKGGATTQATSKTKRKTKTKAKPKRRATTQKRSTQ